MQKLESIKHQKTFVMIKPDGVQRWFIGTIISRLEQKGMCIKALKMTHPTKELLEKHYPVTDEKWVTRLGEKSLLGFEGRDGDPEKYLGTKDTKILGQRIVEHLLAYISSGPCIAMIVEGIQSVDMVRKMIGSTLPNKAEIGTIRGDFSIDTPLIANSEGRALHNLIHASENEEEAKKEIELRFKEHEIYETQNIHHQIGYQKFYQ